MVIFKFIALKHFEDTSNGLGAAEEVVNRFTIQLFIIHRTESW